jgi:hypothetical protein
LQFSSLKNQKLSETSFSHFKIFREKSRESSFLLHRSTKLKRTDSIFVPSFISCDVTWFHSWYCYLSPIFN